MISQLQILYASSIALLVTVAFVLALRPLAPEIGLLDHPGGRKHHVGSVPIIGGVAMYLGILAGFVVIGVFDHFTLGIAFSLFMIAFVGSIDDALSVPAVVRVLVQTAAILIMVNTTGLMIFSIGSPFGFVEIELGAFALIGTLLVGITVINSYNLIDGTDGLAGTLALIPLVTVATLGVVNDVPTALAAITVACILAYMVFNFPVAANRKIRVFMGDAGSALLGFIVFWAVLGVSQGDRALITPVTGLWLASIPVFDLLTCSVRRVLKRRSPFKPGRDHLHHTLQRGGFGALQKVFILGGLQLAYAVVGVTAPLLGVSDTVLFVAWSVLGLTQFKVIRFISKRHRAILRERLHAGAFSSERAARVRTSR